MTEVFTEVFREWLAGVIEGDGTIVTPEEKRRKNGKKSYPHIQLAFHIKDLELANKLVEILGCGSITRDGNTVRLTWKKKADILKVIEIINGKMRTPKILRLHKMIDWYNEEGANIEKKGIDSKPVCDSAWLSGMSDADSNFNIILTLRGNTYRVQRQWRLEIAQKTYHGSDQKEWAEEVSALVGTNLLSRHRIMEEGIKMSSYIIVAYSANSLQNIENYFNLYPLKSSKYQDYKDWKKIGEIKEKTPENYKKIQDLKNGINSKRTYLNWDHIKTWNTKI